MIRVKVTLFLHLPIFLSNLNLEILMFDGKDNDEALNNWFKQMEVPFGLYQIQETRYIFFSRLKIIGHALLWSKSYVDALRIGKNKNGGTSRHC